MITLICGYRRHGKDTLAHNLKSGSLQVYSKSGKPLILAKDYQITHFAKALKQEVYEKCIKQFSYDLSLEDLESLKDEKIFNDSSFRDILIKYGQAKKEGDDTYWAKKVYQDIKDNILKNVVIADWR